MLSERVLDELVRRSAISEELCKALWPDLLVESKLQLLAALQADLSNHEKAAPHLRRTAYFCGISDGLGPSAD